MPTECIQPAPESVTADGASYISGFAKLDDRLVILLDIDELLSPEKLGRVRSPATIGTKTRQQLDAAEQLGTT